ncbi:hypothetical protein KC19_12G117900, partial [Ceratodon purpureus]
MAHKLASQAKSSKFRKKLLPAVRTALDDMGGAHLQQTSVEQNGVMQSIRCCTQIQNPLGRVGGSEVLVLPATAFVNISPQTVSSLV